MKKLIILTALLGCFTQFYSQGNTPQDNGQFEIFNLDINTDKEDFGVVYSGDKVVFTSSRNSRLPIKRTTKLNDFPYLNMFEAEQTEGNQLKNVKLLTRKVNKKFHDGPATFSKDGNLMVFTRNNYDEKSDKGEVKLSLQYRMKNDDGKWGKVTPFNFNNKEHSVGQPALSADGNTLYFASDMPGGMGGTDLYMVKRDVDAWTVPVNLGAAINTAGNEMFPTVHSKGILFFASNGHNGMGGLDVFLSEMSGDSFGAAKNLGAPVNGSNDDFGFVLSEDQKKGFFSSNRDGGKGSDDIYSFNMLKPFAFCNEVKGLIADESDNVLAGVKVMLMDENGKMVQEVTSNEKGEYSVCTEPGKYTLKTDIEKYFDYSKSVTLKEGEEAKTNNITLVKDPGFSLLANVKDEKTGANIEGVTVSMKNNIDNVTTKKTTDANGNVTAPIKNLKLNETVSYNVTFEKEGYLSKTVPFNNKLTKAGVQNVNATLQTIPNFMLAALIMDSKTKAPLEGVSVSVIDNMTNVSESFTTPSNGEITKSMGGKKLNDNISYRFLLKKEGYLTKEVTYNNKLRKEGKYLASEGMNFNMEQISVGGDLSKMIELKAINFDLNKYNIRRDARVELDKIVKVMNEYPSMWIELGAHTDCRGSSRYNESLSDKRARASAEYISSRITDPKRIYGKGYGESSLINDCECEGKVKSRCSEEEHSENRRTEFKIIKF